MYNLIGLLCLETTIEGSKCAIKQKVGFHLRVYKFIVAISSLCYDNLLHLTQILTNLASLHSTLNEVFGNV